MPERTTREAPARSFRALWLSSTASNLGDGVMVATFPLMASAITRDPVAVAGVAACATAPWLLFALPAGAVVDRVDRLRLMRIVDLVRAGTVVALGATVVVGLDRMAVLYAAVFALGCAETLYDSAAMSVLAMVVPHERLERANGRLFAGQLVTNQFAGPPLGAFLFAHSAAAPLWLDAATFAVSALLLVGVRPGNHVPAHGPSAPRRRLAADVAEGIRWMLAERDIRLLACGAAAINLAESAGMSVAVLYATGELGMTTSQFGWVFTAAAGGALAGTVVADRAVDRLGRRTAVVASAWLFAAGLLVAATVAHAASLAAGLAATGFAAQTWNVVAVAYRQRNTPMHLLGRVMSAYRFIAYGSLPVGALLGGTVAAAAAPRATFVFAGAIVLALAVAVSLRLGSLAGPGVVSPSPGG